jgi:hypothetical protein
MDENENGQERFANEVEQAMQKAGIPIESAADAPEGERNALQERMFRLRKKIPMDVIADLEAMDEAALRKKISNCETNILETDKAREADEDLAELKEQAKEAAAPYNDAKKAQRAIAAYCACLMDERGVA